MAYLYVTEQGSVVRKSADRYLVEVEGRIVLDVPYHKLESVLLFGRVQITTQALHEMLERGIQVGLFTRHGRYRGALTPARGKQVDLRLAQFELYRDPVRSLEFARSTLQSKSANALKVLREYSERAKDGEAVGLRVNAIQHAHDSMSSAESWESLLGLEGTAARIYFDALAGYNRSVFEWPGRVKRPATDPMNALLNFVYAVMTHEIAGALEGLGLDPHVGFLHRVDYGRPSLALDLIEPLRHPVADRLVWTVLNRSMYVPEDFVGAQTSGGVVLTPSALKRFLSDYERWMLARGEQSFRRLIRREAEGFVAALRGGEWTPFEWKPVEGDE